MAKRDAKSEKSGKSAKGGRSQPNILVNAEEEPEMDDYPPAKDFPNFHNQFGPRGVLRCKASSKDDPTVDPRFGRVGKQTVEDTGPLTKKRMESCDDDFVASAIDFMKRANRDGKPFFVWLNTTHMHCFTHTKAKSLGQAGRWQSPYHDTMIDHDKNVGQVLDALDEMGIGDEGVVVNDIVQHHDWLPTFLAMAGDPDIVEKCKKGHQAGDKKFKVHIDGYNLLPFLTQKGIRSPRQGFVYFNDDGDIVGLRFDNWKVVFMEQRVAGTMRIWAEPFIELRVPKLFNLRTDPYERADITSNSYYDWFLHRPYLPLAASAIIVPFLESFKEFPPRQKPGSFSLDQALQRMNDAASGAGH